MDYWNWTSVWRFDISLEFGVIFALVLVMLSHTVARACPEVFLLPPYLHIALKLSELIYKREGRDAPVTGNACAIETVCET